MRIGACQYSTDYLQNFELRVFQCGGMSDVNKIMHLDTGIIAKLRHLLLSKSSPYDYYPKWIKKVKQSRDFWKIPFLTGQQVA